MLRRRRSPAVYERLDLHPALAGLGQGDSGVPAQTQHFRLAFKSIAKAPEFSAGGGYLKAKAFGIGQTIIFFAEFGGSSRCIGEGQGKPYGLALAGDLSVKV